MKFKKGGKHLGIKNSSLVIYCIGIFISLSLISLYLINIKGAWCIISCSIGASLLGAVLLAYFIDLNNQLQNERKNKMLIRFINIDIYRTVTSLITVLNIIIKDVDSIYHIKTDISISNEKLEFVFKLLSSQIQEIETLVAPVVAMNEEISTDEIKITEKIDKIKSKIQQAEDSLKSFRESFNNCKKQFEINKNFLLVSEIANEYQIMKIEGVLNILGTPCNKLVKTNQLFEFGESFEEILRCKIFDIFDELGFKDIRFSNEKGYLELNII